jgi:hypothetical protein
MTLLQKVVGTSAMVNLALAAFFPNTAVLQVLELCHCLALLLDGQFFFVTYLRTSKKVIDATIEATKNMQTKNVYRRVTNLKKSKNKLKATTAIAFGCMQILSLTFAVLPNKVWPGSDGTSSCQRRDWHGQSSLVTFRFYTYAFGVSIGTVGVWSTTLMFAKKRKRRIATTPQGGLAHHGPSSGTSPLYHVFTTSVTCFGKTEVNSLYACSRSCQ